MTAKQEKENLCVKLTFLIIFLMICGFAARIIMQQNDLLAQIDEYKKMVYEMVYPSERDDDDADLVGPEGEADRSDSDNESVANELRLKDIRPPKSDDNQSSPAAEDLLSESNAQNSPSPSPSESSYDMLSDSDEEYYSSTEYSEEDGEVDDNENEQD